MKHNLTMYTTLLVLSLASAACSYGTVSDAETSAMIGGARVSYRMPDMTGSSTVDVVPSLGAEVWARTWSATDPGVSTGGATGTGSFYLNPYASFTHADERTIFVNQGWQRLVVSKSGYDTRRFYRNHLYTSCAIPAAQGPYSAGPYPYVAANATPSVAGSTLCAADGIKLYKSTSNYIKDPDIIVDRRTLNDRVISTSCEGLASRCVRVSVGTANVGDGDLWLRGNIGSPTVTQRRFRRNGTIESTTLPNAVFEFHPTHGHIHLQNWSNLRLRRRDSTCSTEATATACPVVGVPGQKISFCLTETAVFDSSYTPNPARASGCTFNSATGEINQGIGSGREDTYTRGLPGQMIGIDGLAAGNYWLEVEVNPANADGQRTILESDYTNNITRAAITL